MWGGGEADAWAAEMEAELEGLSERERGVKMEEMQAKLYTQMAEESRSKDERAAAVKKVKGVLNRLELPRGVAGS